MQLRHSLLACLLAGATVSAQAQEIIITASKVEASREETGSAVSIIDSEHLENNQITLVEEALREVPGLTVSQTGGIGGRTSLRIRGLEPNQTLVLIDGVEVNDNSSVSEFNFADLLNLDIERIEVLRGAQSAIWGSDAAAGVVNIITKQGKGPLNGSVTVATGSYDTNQQSFNLNGGDEVYNVALSGSLLDSSGISAANSDRGHNEKDGYSNSTLNFKGGMQATENLELNLVLRHVDAFQETDKSEYPSGFIVDDDSAAKRVQNSGRISAKLDSADGNWQQEIGYAFTKSREKNFAFNSNALGRKRKLDYQSNYFIHSDAAEHRLTLVAEREEEDFDYKSSSTNVHEGIDTNSLVAEYGLNLDETYYFTLAGRRDWNDRFANANTYRVSFAAWLNDDWRLHTSRGTGIKNPTLFEMFGFASNFVSNPDLDPEETTSTDMGLEYHFTDLDGYADATLFHNDIRNQIKNSGNTVINQEDDSSIKGLELTATLNPTDDLRLSASYTYSQAEDASGKQLIRHPEHTASLNASQLLSNGKTRLSGGLQFTGRQNDTRFSSTNDPVELDSYTVANLAVTHAYSDNIEIFTKVNNLFDEDYEEIYGYGTPGINFMVGIKLSGEL
ncbi:TonB-dependent receptor plug domain-containing protein [Aliamphritea hakodatensis]|uniref:TonB-dependent receptor plug domain-containing protein n=1 Tax=Aliamphritea hakodatensis TaxID=2895352 RepID=UPI0022FDA82A|nr:TonB-dependent receptor [Aliamphritea hakodatensis]